VRVTILIVFVLIFSPLHCQDSHYTLVKNLLDSAAKLQYVDFDQTEKLVRQAENLIVNHDQKEGIIHLIRGYEIRIQSCINFSQFRLYRQYLDDVDRLLERNKQMLDDAYVKHLLQNEFSKAQYYNWIDDYRKAQEIFTRLLDEYKKMPESMESCRALQFISNDLASIHYRFGEFEASVNQFMACVPYYECYCRYLSRSGDYTLIYRNIGQAYLAKKDYVQADRYLQLSENSLQDRLKQNPVSASRIALSLYESQASYHAGLNDFDNALISLRKSILLLDLPSVDDEFKGRIFSGLGDVYLGKGDLGAAKHHYLQAELHFMRSPTSQVTDLSGLYTSMAKLWKKMGDMDQALLYCNEAAERVVLNPQLDKDGNPLLKQVISKKHLFAALHQKSSLLEKMYQEMGNVPVLKKAFRTNQLALALLDSTANEFTLDKDKIILREQSHSAFEVGIRMAHELYRQTGDGQYFNDCFGLADKSKGVLLLENLRMVNRFSGVKQEWLEKEKALKSEINRMEQSLYEAELKRKKDDELSLIRDRYLETKKDYEVLVAQIKKEAPDYYHLRFDRSAISPEEVQESLLGSNEALIEFFLGDSTLMTIGFSSGKKFLSMENVSENFFEGIHQLRKALISPEAVLSKTEFDSLTRKLFGVLLADCLTTLGEDINSLIIIPDGILGYLPFEILAKPGGDELSYLVNEFSIRYAYSSSYLHELTNKKPALTKEFFAGFVSVAGNDTYGLLKGARKEVDDITQLLRVGFNVFDPASKEAFLQQAPNFRVLHLAMHSRLNDQNPMMSELVFSADNQTGTDLLTATELYNMKLNADMVVLSACETGIGQIHRGEGIMSFSRAFAYAGASSAVISLWKVPDKATSLMMIYYYSFLKEGKSKDEALRLAKSKFVKDYPQMAHPFYWAGFILSGKKDALDFPTSGDWWWYVAGLAVLLTLFLVRKKVAGFTRTS
jgi:tetratricopeptide (TPR) repeat protein